ncbi:MAG: FUSC family protein [Clostridia bacterium]|nr:FUSC family protein [Erysipelotrichia bacterium]NCC87267.1 FUSC family protein [Clostridia bacterium]
MPKIGMRIIKSALAVFVCCVIDYFRGEGYPFYSAIAAILCMQKEVGKGINVAKNRMVGTCIGGVCGYLALLLVNQPIFAHELIRYALLSLCIVPVMYITILLKKQNATYITCVVFLCVTITHGSDVSPALFAFNRVVDTFIGILVSLCINQTIFVFKEVEEMEENAEKENTLKTDIHHKNH